MEAAWNVQNNSVQICLKGTLQNGLFAQLFVAQEILSLEY
jgi:hypothetical protein